ncbi:fatty acyl-CoA reductase wat-like [Leptidea sinapis]|uniref:fatty acyl-CoA reductase wat-like n=1 Tax=Leptidea sinapis TaxID=189913 RepID=UPI002145224C|nr:fatty acyl-CoA reductase wat-like [Leptidea sinapis]
MTDYMYTAPAKGVTEVIEGNDITYNDMVEEVCLENSQIQQAFSGATVLLSGGTGFLGKLLIEKLLRSCPDIKKLYLLARPKKNKDTAKRFQEQFDDMLYHKLKKVNPDFTEKIQVIEGEISLLDLGISDVDRQKIINEVEFIFHGAATVRFDENLKSAVNINVRASKGMLMLARACTKLKAYVHVSTAYSHCTRSEIDEVFYDTTLDGDKLIDLVENMDDKVIADITPGLLGDYPNTYAFTKAAAEDVVLKYSRGLPVALFRPSIVIATADDPIVGWIDNVYGPTGVVVGSAVGLLHVLNCNQKNIADLVPGDVVVNACIAVAWKTARDHRDNHEAPPQDTVPVVYNCVSSVESPVTWEQYMKLNEGYGLKVPPIQAIWGYLLILTPSAFLYTIYSFILHWIPAYIIDAVLVIIGKKPMLKQAYKKIQKFSGVIGYFALRQWKFYNNNMQSLYKEMGVADKTIFKCSMAGFDWSHYFYNHVRGIRVYLLKDPLDTVPQGLRKQLKLRLLSVLLMAVLGFVMLRLLVWFVRWLV